MPRNFLKPVELGDRYEVENQGLAGILAGLSFFGYAVFIDIADATETESVVSALARFVGMCFVIAIAITVQYAFPKAMRPQKLMMAGLCGVGMLADFRAVHHIMRPIAQVMEMYTMLHISKISYIAVLVISAYCLARHPRYPTWIRPTLVPLTTCWMFYYASIETGTPNTLLKYIVWSICYPMEYVCAISFIVSASGLLTDARTKMR